MTAIERQFFIVCGKINLITDTESEDYETLMTYAQTLISLAANHYEQIANRHITDDEWIDLLVDPDSQEYPDDPLVLGSDWVKVKSTLILMACELYSKVGANGFSSISEGGLSQGYIESYSKALLSMINTQKKIRIVKIN